MRHALTEILGWLSVASVISDIGSFLSGGWSQLKEFAGQVWKSFRRIWTFLSGIFGHLGDAWQLLHDALRTLILGLEELAEGTYKITRFLVHTLIPKRIRVALGKIATTVYNKAKGLFDLARKQLRKAYVFLMGRIDRVLDWGRKAVRTVTRLANRALNWIHKAGQKVADLVLHPKRLVAWILPSLVTPLARWILSHIASLAALMLRYFLHNVGKFARDIEAAILRIF